RHLAENSYLSVGVPGTVMGLNTALQKYGTLPLATVMAPAIRLAEQGFVLTNDDTAILKQVYDLKPQPNVTQIFLKNGQPLKAGDLLKQPELAKTLKAISNGGTAVFYQGAIAQKIVAAGQADHGVLAMRDFTHYHVIERPVLTCRYRGYQIVTDPPPSSGVVICEIFHVLNHFPINQSGFHSAAAVHYNVEAMRYAFADRNQELGDPAFVDNPTAKLMSASYAHQIAESIKTGQAGNSTQLIQKNHTPVNEGQHTTHYSVVDRAGNAVAVTYTINAYFGSGMIAKDTGFFLNDDLDDFTISLTERNKANLQQGRSNFIAPYKRPLSSMSPTMVFKNGQLFMVLGAAGGPTIITTIVEAIENVVDYGMDINAAINQPRFHFQWIPDVVYLEPFALSPDTISILQKMGYQTHNGSPFNTDYWGQAMAIVKDPQTGALYGATDNRHAGGVSLGY
ncbi:MAG: gamma-glutamyltransferase, partial [Proteobacteria bacterium]|nr:gamma-glutamyltransferase [Pseudomonadota bacterium]